MKIKEKIIELNSKFKNSKFKKNVAPKLLSLFIAMFLWLYVIDQVNPELEKVIENVKVELVNVDKIEKNGLIILDNKDYYVDVKIKGRRSDILSIKDTDILITADLMGFDKGVVSVPLEKKLNSSNVMIEDLSKNDIKINLDKTVEIAKSVDINIVGELTDGYVMDDLKISPDEILVRGPESIVNKVAKLEGELNINNITYSISKQIPIKPVDNDGNIVNGITIGTNYVSVEENIYKLKIVPLNVEIKGTVAPGYKLVGVNLNPEGVTIKGLKDNVESIDSIYTESIDVNGVSNSFIIEKNLLIPEGLETPYLINPVKIRINVEKIVSKEFNYSISQIPIYNLNSDFSTNISDLSNVVKIKIYDTESVLDGISIDDIRPNIDGSSFDIGNNSAKIEVNKEFDIQNIEVFPSNINIIVSDINDTNNIINDTNQDN